MAIPKQKYISASQVNMFLECPIKYRTIYVEGAHRMPANEYMTFGKAIHHALEYNYRQKILSRKDLSIKEITEEYKKYWDNDIKNSALMRPQDLKKLYFHGEDLLFVYMKEQAPFIQPAYVEKKFEIELKSIGVTILGYIDLITEDGVIIDHKTVSRGTRRSWTQNYMDNNIQFTMYSLAYRKLFNSIESGIRADLLCRDKDGAECTNISTFRTDEELLQLVHLLDKMQVMTKNDLHYPNFLSCKSCDFKRTCPKI